MKSPQIFSLVYASFMLIAPDTGLWSRGADVPFLLVSPLNVFFLKEVTKMYTKVNKQNHKQVKIKLNTLKRS